jgi:hypothetical protein
MIDDHRFGWRGEPTAAIRSSIKRAGLPAGPDLSDVLLLPSVDLRAGCRILNQGRLGSCVSNSCAQAVRYAQLKSVDEPYPFMARLWGYSLALAAQGQSGQDVGTYNCLLLEQISAYGFPPESAWPYSEESFGDHPPLEAYRQARDQAIELQLGFHAILETGDARLLAVQQALCQGKLVVFGAPVTEEFAGTNPAPGHVFQRPRAEEQIAGGHSECWCGYEVDPDTGLLRFRTVNSWGTEWGDDGFTWMDEGYVTWDQTSDLWIVSYAKRYSGGLL